MAPPSIISQPAITLVRSSKDDQDVKIYQRDEVALHNTADDCWVTLGHGVYDITAFLGDHPGGKDIILEHAGGSLDQIFFNPAIHRHTMFARKLLESYRIGSLPMIEEDGQAEKEISVEAEEEQSFLDLSQPLMPQMLRKRFSKAFYLEQVHKPRHLPHPAVFFPQWPLELLTRTPWYVIPLVWLPFVGHLLQQASSDLSILTLGCLWLLGLGLWTVFEYAFHRFLFHLDDHLPDWHPAFCLHFLLHGVHHFLPMDRYRLVMPPIMFSGLLTPVWYLAKWTVGSWLGHSIRAAIVAGSVTGYIVYDLLHYYFHHGSPLGSYIRLMKRYHMDHHYVDYHRGFGVSSPIWDVVFSTGFPL